LTGWRSEKPAYEELFHLTDDPHELRNLATDGKYAKQLAAMRTRCVEQLRLHRGDPKSLPTISAGQWLKEAPPNWQKVLKSM